MRAMGPLDAEIAIVGGGPSGMCTALFLLHHAPDLRGKVVVLEKETYPRDKICAGAVGLRAENALRDIGVSIDVPSAWVNGLSVTSPFGTLAVRRPEPIGRVVRRIAFDEALMRAGRERGVSVLEGARVANLRTENDHVSLGLSSGQTVRAAAVIGADGVGSVVRRSVGLGRGTLIAQAVEIDTALRPTDPARDLLHFDVQHRSLRGYAWDFPTIVNEAPLACRGVYELREPKSTTIQVADPSNRSDIGERLAMHLRERELPVDKHAFRRFSERGLELARPFSRPRTLLVGEAAGIDPILGEGIAQAILYGQTAGAYLAQAHRQKNYSFEDWPNVMRRARVGLDLTIRTALAPVIYDYARPLAERFVTRSEHFAMGGICYFAGIRVSRLDLAKAALTLAKTIAALGAQNLFSTVRNGASVSAS